MAHVVKPLMHFPKWHHYLYLTSSSFTRLVQSPYPTNFHQTPLLLPSTSSLRQAHFRSLKLRDSPLPSDQPETDSDSDGTSRKSRNEKKREARRAVKWGMDLAKFSSSQIKRIFRVASVDEDVFEAVMLVKRLGPDVREGKRRQFNYIGRLLREVEPELMDGLIQATKEGDYKKFQALSGSQLLDAEEVEKEIEQADYEDDEEVSEDYIALTDRWFDGLINKDIDITKEIYSLSEVEFDRQELRGLVRKVQSIRENQINSDEDEGKVNSDIIRAERSLTRFLRGLAKQIPA